MYSFNNKTCECQCYDAGFLRSVVRAWDSQEVTSLYRRLAPKSHNKNSEENQKLKRIVKKDILVI